MWSSPLARRLRWVAGAWFLTAASVLAAGYMGARVAAEALFDFDEEDSR